MSRHIAFIPAAPRAAEVQDLYYREESSRAGGLFVLMQDASPRASQARAGFLRACFRHAVSRYLDADRPVRAPSFLRECAAAFDTIARAVDTRLDDFEELGIFVVVREPGALYLLCARGAAARVRDRGSIVPLSAPDISGVAELPIETTRAQHDLFTPTLPETLAIYRVTAPVGPDARHLFLGGSAQDMGLAVDTADQSQARDRTVLDRLQWTVLMLGVEPAQREQPALIDYDTTSRRSFRVPAIPRGVVAGAAGLLIVVAAAVGVNSWRNGGEKETTSKSATHIALKQSPSPPPAQERVAAEVVADSERAEEKSKRGFGIAWEQTFRAAVTSSPAVAGDAVVFGGRDGRVYSVHRGSGERQWSYVAQGGVGASPVVRGAMVVAADYAGNVVRLRAGDGKPVWKRALREKIVSTPAVTNERVAAGTVSGRVYAMSLDTGRVLWKFSARGAIRGGIAHAKETFFVPSHDGRLYAVAEDTGTRRWAVSLGGPVASSPASDGEIVVIGTARGDVVALDVTSGKERWRTHAGGEVNSALALVDGKVYAGASDRRLYCMDAGSGELLWRFDTEGVILSRPYVGDGRVVVTSYDGAVYCLDLTGTLIDRYATDESIFSSPVVVDGRVFFGNNAGRFYCLDSPES